MPNYYVHEVFGERVAHRLPAPLRRAIAQDPTAFRVGLYGPDPLIFSPGCLNTARKLHANWQEELDCVQHLMNSPQAGEVSFAAGWLCHMALDDACHQYIHRMEEERDLSHMLMEMSLDFCMLQEERTAKPNPFRVYQKPRISKLAASLITPAKTWQYFEGLWSMGMTCNLMVATKSHWKQQVTQEYLEPTARLRRIVEETVRPTVHLTNQLWEGVQSEEEEGLLLGSI